MKIFFQEHKAKKEDILEKEYIWLFCLHTTSQTYDMSCLLVVESGKDEKGAEGRFPEEMGQGPGHGLIQCVCFLGSWRKFHGGNSAPSSVTLEYQRRVTPCGKVLS